MKRQNLVKSKLGHKIALYIRVSTEEQASNPEGSIKSQEQRLRSHIDYQSMNGPLGEVVGVYIDRAKSGKDTNRPELQRLLQSIRRHEVSLVMVSELSRLSRSIKDFCEIWELMRSCECEFQSLREQFDTTTAAGEMVLYTIANIAQFERKQTSERIAANFKARAERGLFNGGSIPIGYRRHPENKGHLLIDEEEAKTVREAFSAFLSEGCLTKAGQSLNNRGFTLPRRRACGGNRARLGYFTLENLYRILTNPIYAGIKRYESNGETKSTKAVWEAIIDENTFKSVQESLQKNRSSLKMESERRFPYVLSGLLYCAQCGDVLSGKSAHGNGGKIGYYEHGWATRRQSCLNKKVFACHPNRILAKRLEGAVWEQIEQLLKDPEIAKSIVEEAKIHHESQEGVAEQDRLRNKLLGIQEQIEALAEHLTKIPKGLDPTPIYNQMQRLNDVKDSTRKEVENMVQCGVSADIPVALRDYHQFLGALRTILVFADSPELRRRLIRWIIAKVEVLPNSFRLHYFVGKSHISPMKWEQVEKLKSAIRREVLSPQKTNVGPDTFSASADSPLFLDFGSNSLYVSTHR